MAKKKRSSGPSRISRSAQMSENVRLRRQRAKEREADQADQNFESTADEIGSIQDEFDQELENQALDDAEIDALEQEDFNQEIKDNEYADRMAEVQQQQQINLANAKKNAEGRQRLERAKKLAAEQDRQATGPSPTAIPKIRPQMYQPQQAPQKRDDGELSDLQQALFGGLTTLAGYVFGGNEGASLGAAIGAKGFREREKRRAMQAEKDAKRLNELDKQRQISFGNVSDLRKERSNHKFTKDTNEVLRMRQQIQSAKNLGQKGVSDTAAVFAFMKVLDPGSVVREGEFAQVRGAAGLTEQAKTAMNRFFRGDQLSDPQRKAIFKFIDDSANRRRDQQNQFDEQFREIARRNGLPEEEVILDFNFDPGVDERIGTKASAGAKVDRPDLPLEMKEIKALSRDEKIKRIMKNAGQ